MALTLRYTRGTGKFFHKIINYGTVHPRHLINRVSINHRYFLATNNFLISQTKTLSGPDVISCNISHDRKKRKPLWYYDNKGIRKRKIDQLMRNSIEVNPKTPENTLVSDDVQHMQQILEAFGSCDFTRKEISNLLFSKPRIFGLTRRNIYNRLNDLQDYGYPKDTVKNMVMKSPGIMLFDEKEISLQQRLSALQEISLTPKLSPERCIYLVQKCPQLLSISKKSVYQSKIKNLHQLGFNRQLVFELVMKFPPILTYSEKSVKEKVDYIINEIGGRVGLFVSFPRVFSASLRRIKERHLFLVNEGYLTRGSSISENKLRALVLTTDKDFIYRVTKTKMKDYRKFQQQLRKDELDEESCVTNNNDFNFLNSEEIQSEIEDDDIYLKSDYDEKDKHTYLHAFKSEYKEDYYNVPFPDKKENTIQTRKPNRSTRYRPIKKRAYRKSLQSNKFADW